MARWHWLAKKLSLKMVKELTDYIEGETSILTSCMWYLDLYATEIIKLINQIAKLGPEIEPALQVYY